MIRGFLLKTVAFLCLFSLSCLGSEHSVFLESTSMNTEVARNSVAPLQPAITDVAYNRAVQSSRGISALPLSVFHPIGASQQASKQITIKRFCERLDYEFKKLGWQDSSCLELPWQYQRTSELGQPLIFWEYNGLKTVERPRTSKDETTIVLGGVHPDEINPIHLAFRFAKSLNLRAEIYADRRVIIAPLVNPDGFFTKPYRRTNINGVDLNRNFATQDWWRSANAKWKLRRKSDPRHFPGFAPLTEEGTRFQVDLLDTFDADKVISIHAPLGFLDYDGPGDTKKANLSKNEKKARELAHLVSRNSNNYQIKDFVFYPGSLGNFSGNERNIPTVTLELESTNPKLANKYWNDFYPGLVSAVRYDFQKEKASMADLGLNNLNEKN